MTDPTLADAPPEQSLADVLHVLVDHGRLPDEETARRAHRAIDAYFADTAPAVITDADASDADSELT